MGDALTVPADEAFPVLARQHRRRLSEVVQVRTRLVASGALPKAYAGPSGRTHVTVDGLGLITLGLSATDKTIYAPLAVETYPFLESLAVETGTLDSSDGEEPLPLALWLRNETHVLFEAMSTLFVAAAKGELDQRVYVRLEVNRTHAAAELIFRDRRSGIAVRLIYMPPPGTADPRFFASMPDYHDTTIGTSTAYRLHREYFIAIGNLLREYQEKAAAEPRPGRRRHVDREAPGNNRRGVKNKPTPPDGQPAGLPHPEGLVQQERASCRKGSASRRPHAV